MIDPKESFFADLARMSGRGVKPGLERIREALNCLGRPDKDLRVIHVAGTNGKGSSCALIAELLAVSGYSVGFSLSPHVHDYRERMQFYDRGAGGGPRLIPEEELLAAHWKLLAAVPDSLGLTYFEWSIALAIQFFHDRRFDYVVLETGMGGRWDATNACAPVLSGVTTIGFDHMVHLGPTLAAILGEKQEIAKPGVDFLFGPRDPGLIRQAREHCSVKGAIFRPICEFSGRFAHQVEKHPFFARKPPCFCDNFVFALAAGQILKECGVAVDFAAFLGLTEYHLPPARCEKISESPVIHVDGAHNEMALRRLKEFADTEWPAGYDLVFGCLGDRDFTLLAGLIASDKGRNFWVRFDGAGRDAPMGDYEAAQARYGGEIVELDGILRSKLEGALKPVLVCGSLYLCAQFAAFWHGGIQRGGQ